MKICWLFDYYYILFDDEYKNEIYMLEKYIQLI